MGIQRLGLTTKIYPYTTYSTVSFNYNCPAGGGSCVLVVSLSGIGGAGPFSNVRYADRPLTRAHYHRDGYSETDIWYLLAPPAGAHAFELTIGRRSALLGLACYSGVKQSDPLFAVADDRDFSRPDQYHINGSVSYPKDGLVIHSGFCEMKGVAGTHMDYQSGPLARIVSEKSVHGEEGGWHTYHMMGEYVRSGAAGSQSWQVGIPYGQKSLLVQAVFNPATPSQMLPFQIIGSGI